MRNVRLGMLASLILLGASAALALTGRDPGFPPPFNTTLTDALEYSIGS